MNALRIAFALGVASFAALPSCSSSSPAKATPTDYLIISADSLAASAGRWRDYRKDAHVVELALASTVIGSSGDPTTAIHDYVKARYAARDTTKPFFVLLVGDADGATVSPATVPVATVSSPDGPVVTDNIYADMTDDGIPDLALGRIAVHTDAEVDAVRAKIAKYESSYVSGAHARRINLFASTSGFGEPADTLIETLVFKVIEEIPYDYDITMTYAKQDSPYVFVPERFSDKVYDRINEGALMVAYVGHGYQQGFASLDWGGKSFPILDSSQLGKIVDGPKAPILTLIACATGAFSSGESVSEQILRSATGPVAVLSSTENSHPYPNAIFVRELGQVLAVKRVPTIGEAFVAVKDRMIHNDDALRKTIDNAVSSQVDSTQQKTLKRSHLDMYTLFGDPAMRIAYPGNGATLSAPPQVAPGASADVSLAVKSDALKSGNVVFSLEIARSDIHGTPAAVPADGDPGRDAVIEANYTMANLKVIVSRTAPLANGAAAAKLAVPTDLAPGDYWVKAYADDGTHDAAASTKIHVAP